MSAAARVAAFGLGLAAAAIGVVGGAVLTPTMQPTAGAGTIDTAGPTVSDASGERIAAADAVIADAVAQLVGGSLSARVSVVGLDPAAGPAAALVADDLRTAGAVVTSVIVLEQGWTDPALAALRSGLAGQLTGGRGDDSLHTTLALAIGGGDADGSAGGSGTVLAALQGAGILTVVEAPDSGSPDAAPSAASETGAGSETSAAPGAGSPAAADPVVTVFVTSGPVTPEAAAGWADLLSTWRTTVPATAVIAADHSTQAAAAADSSLVVDIRQGPLASAVATVDHAGTGWGRVAVVRLAARLPQQPVGHYGFLPGAGAALPPAPVPAPGP